MPEHFRTHENTLFDSGGEISRLRADERLYGDHYAEAPSVYYIYCFFHGWKPVLV